MSEPCCGRPAFRRAWVPCWPFRATHCACCGETALDCNLLVQFVWILVFRFFWDGTVVVEEVL